MSENILIFLISSIGSALTTIVVFSWQIGKFSEKIRILDALDTDFNQLENSIIEINAKLELLTQSLEHKYEKTNQRITNLKNNARTSFRDLRYSQNELITYIQNELKPERSFILRNRDEDEKESWTQVND